MRDDFSFFFYFLGSFLLCFLVFGERENWGEFEREREVKVK